MAARHQAEWARSMPPTQEKADWFYMYDAEFHARVKVAEQIYAAEERGDTMRARIRIGALREATCLGVLLGMTSIEDLAFRSGGRPPPDFHEALLAAPLVKIPQDVWDAATARAEQQMGAAADISKDA